MISPVSIAVVQQETLPGQVKANRDKALRHASEALSRGADIVLFHEELTVGYVDNLQDLAEPADGPTTQAFRKLLVGSDAKILWGLTERDGDQYYIGAPVVTRDGVEANYRKTHLWWKADGIRHEPTSYAPGHELVTFDLKGHRCGIMICYDGDFPEVTRSYALMGCSIVFWLNNRGSRGHEEVTDLARRNSMIIASACCCGKNERGSACRGGSNITDADGSLLAEIWDDEGVITADVDPARALKLREENPWFVGRRPDLYV